MRAFSCLVMACFLVCAVNQFSHGDDKLPERFVTNLNDSGDGSLRSVLIEDGPTKIVFKIAGDIILSKPMELIGHNIVLDGSNAPDGSVRIIGFATWVKGSNCDIRNMRFWPGDRINDPERSSDQDGIVIWGTKDRPVTSCRISNCTVFAAIDEGISTYGPVQNVDIGRNMIIWGCSNSHHKDVLSAKNPETAHHSMAILVSGESEGIRFAQNCLAFNRHRNPRVKPGASVGFVNNLIYGWGSSADDGLYFAADKGISANLRIAFLNNFYKGVPDSYFPARANTATNLLQNIRGIPNEGFGSTFRLKNAKNYAIWDKGNSVVTSLDENYPFSAKPKEFVSDYKQKLGPEDFKTLLPTKVLTAEEAYEVVLREAGAFPSNRDAVETAIVKHIKEGTGNFIDSPKDLPFDYPYEK